MTSHSIQKAGHLALDYLMANIRVDGSFIYKQHAGTGEVSKDYNILRHAGCLYVLYKYLDPDHRRSSAHPLESAEFYLLRHCTRVQDSPDCSCGVENKSAKLGGAALTLLALIESYRCRPKQQILDIMKRLASFLVLMQEPDSGDGPGAGAGAWCGDDGHDDGDGIVSGPIVYVDGDGKIKRRYRIDCRHPDWGLTKRYFQCDHLCIGS